MLRGCTLPLMAKKPAPTSELPPAAWRIAIIYGKESFLRMERTAELREALVKQYGGVDLMTFSGETARAADVLDECRSFGLIAQHKLVIVEDAEDLVKEDVRPLFERYAEAPCEGATLVLRSGNWRAGKLDKLVAQCGALVACDPLNDREAEAWVAARAKSEHKVKIDKDAAGLLVVRVGAELGKLDTELGKLAAAAGTEAVITSKLVGELVGVSREEAVWGIQQTLLTAGAEEAVGHLRYVLDISRQPEVLVMYAFLDLARKVHAVSRGLRQGMRAEALKGPLKLWGPSVEAVLNTGRHASPESALRLLRECVQADTRSKSGFGEMGAALERLAVRFSQLLQPAGAAR